MRSLRVRSCVALICGAVLGIPHSARGQQSPADPARLASVIRTGLGQEWADALVRLAHDRQASTSDVEAIRQGLADHLPAARARAAQAAGALGLLAAAAAPQLVTLLTDTSADVVREVAFALGVLHERNERVLRALFHAAVPASGKSSGAALLAITALGRYPLVPVSAAFGEELRRSLHSPQSRLRSVSLRTSMRTDVAWAPAEFTRLLADPDPGIRLDAA